MGYYGEVAIVIKESDYPKLLEAIDLYDKGKKGTKDFLNMVEMSRRIDYKKEHYLVFHWENVKWYSHFPEVEFFDRLENHMGDDFEYDFLRIGEDRGDIEERNTLDSGILWVECSIGF